jgi:hypothetical protein
MSVRKICVFLFVNCVFIFQIANTFVALYAMKYSEISFVMGRKRGVERGPLKIFLHLLGGHDEIINESMQNHQPPPLLIKNERSLI